MRACIVRVRVACVRVCVCKVRAASERVCTRAPVCAVRLDRIAYRIVSRVGWDVLCVDSEEPRVPLML